MYVIKIVNHVINIVMHVIQIVMHVIQIVFHLTESYCTHNFNNYIKLLQRILLIEKLIYTFNLLFS